MARKIGFSRLYVSKFLFFLIALCICQTLSGWGFFAHKKINHYAVFTLPTMLAQFYKSNVHYLAEHAVDPDRRRAVMEGEGERHYIDLDLYGAGGGDAMLLPWGQALGRYGEDTLRSRGILPWQIQFTYRQLVSAFSEGNSKAILKLSADLGHYIADAHVPLHTTSNYNGMQTGQEGIHAFWESRLPEAFAPAYNFAVGKARYIEDTQAEAWGMVAASFLLVDSVLAIEKALSASYRQDQKYRYEKRNGQLVRTYSASFSSAYHTALNGMVERRMRDAIISIGSYWYSAWVDAGQPYLQRPTAPSLPIDTVQPPAQGQKIHSREEWH